MPKIGTDDFNNSRISPTSLFIDAGSPGPFERKMPSGFIATASAADVAAGTTVVRHPSLASSRREFLFTPKSKQTTWKRSSHDAGTSYASLVVTILASSRFSMRTDWPAFAAKLSSFKSMVERQDRMAPLSRM